MNNDVTFISVFFGFLILCACQNAKDNAVKRISLEHNEADKEVAIKIGDDLFTVYNYHDTLRKPILFPVYSAGGVPVTRGFPIEPRANERIDHPHQTGVWFNFGDVNGIDFWNNSYARPKEELHLYGSIRQTGIEIIQNEGDTAEFAVASEWLRHDGAVLLYENARFFFTGNEVQRTFERRTELTAAQDTIILRDNKEGLFAIRVARAFESPSEEPLILTGEDGQPSENPTLDNTGVTGHYMGSNGLEGAAVWGTPNKWIALSAVDQNDSITIAIFDHPDNPGFPAYWHARDYGLFSANNFGRKAYNPDLQPRKFRLNEGESLRFKHRLLIKSGGFLNREELEREFERFSKGE